jgi:gamma-glutamyltranspeptidase/glutathione hydrolase
MYEHLHDKISGAAPRLQHFAASVDLFLRSDKKTPRVAVGETFKNPDLADTLARLGEKGVDDFYDGKLANEIVQAVTSAVNPRTGRGGVMTKEDLRGYRAVWRRPVNTTYRGYQVFSMGPPSGGAVAMVEALNILEGLDLSSMHHNSADYLHAVSEAMNLAWSDRDTYLADPDFTPMPLSYEADDVCESFDNESCPPGCTRLPDGGSLPPKEAVTGELPRRGGCGAVGLLSKAYARARRALMGVHSGKVVKAPIMAGDFSLLQWRDWLPGTHDNSGTTHLSVVDAAGNMVALTTTIENNLGSGVVVPGRGFLLNNELTDFSFDQKTGSGAGYANRPEGGRRLRSSALGDDAHTKGGKRPRSSMTPTVVLDAAGKPLLAIGSPGGGRITYTVLGALLSLLDFNMSLRDAINAPRAIARNGPLELETREKCRCDKPIGEDGYVMSVLRARGMPVRFSQGSTTSDYLEAVMVLGNGSFDSYADMKRMPTALGAMT